MCDDGLEERGRDPIEAQLMVLTGNECGLEAG